MPGFSGVKAGFTEQQKRAMGEITEKLRNIIALDKDLQDFARDYESADADVRSLQQKVEGSGGGTTNSSGVLAEFETIRQMSKMTCGRTGNHFPILSREYYHSSAREIGMRENIIETLRWIESVDPRGLLPPI